MQPRAVLSVPASIRLVAFTAACLLVAAFIASAPSSPAVAIRAQAGATAHYASGWNIVAAPSASALPGATMPYFAFGPGSSDYSPVAPGNVVGGRAVWAFFSGATDVALGASAASFSSVLAPANQWVLIGNPSTTTALPLTGADAAMAYDAARGYFAVDTLQPGQGAWVMTFQGGAISAGTAGSAGSEIARLQAAMTADPTDRNTLNRVAARTSEMLQSRQFDQLQGAIDDLWAAGVDGLQERGSGALPSLTGSQFDAAVEVREDLAAAFSAAQAGDLAASDRAIEKAKAAAQASEDDAVALARGQGGGEQSFVYSSVNADNGTSGAAAGNLAAYGGLLHAAFFNIALGKAPSDDFWSVATAVINGAPVPQANPPQPSNPPPGQASGSGSRPMPSSTAPSMIIIYAPSPSPAATATEPPNTPQPTMPPHTPTATPTRPPTPSPTPPPTKTPTPTPRPSPSPSPPPGTGQTAHTATPTAVPTSAGTGTGGCPIAVIAGTTANCR